MEIPRSFISNTGQQPLTLQIDSIENLSFEITTNVEPEQQVEIKEYFRLVSEEQDHGWRSFLQQPTLTIANW